MGCPSFRRSIRVPHQGGDIYPDRGGLAQAAFGLFLYQMLPIERGGVV